MSGTVAAFLTGAERALVLVGDCAAGWGHPSVLAPMTVGELAAHLCRAVLQVDAYWRPGTRAAPTTDAAGYFAALAGTTEPGSALNRGVRSRAAQTAGDGHGALAERSRLVLARLGPRLEAVGEEALGVEVVVVGHRDGPVLTLAEYLRTRCVELAVHTEDLALSLGVRPEVPAGTAAVAVDVLQAAARRRHGDVAVLRALARRERDDLDAARVL